MPALGVLLIGATQLRSQAPQTETFVQPITGSGRVARLERFATIGNDTSGNAYAFTHVTHVLPARDGTVWIVDFQNADRATVRQYDREGRYLRTVGGYGAGPGEYRTAVGLAQLADGRVVLRDDSNLRLNVYSEDGKSVDTWRLPRHSYPSTGLNGIVADRLDVLWLPFRSGATRLETTRYLRVDGRTGVIIDTVPAPSHPPTNGLARVKVAGGGTRPIEVPNATTYASAVHFDGRLVTAMSDRYEILLQARPALSRRSDAPQLSAALARGDRRVALRRDVAPKRLTDREFHEVVAKFEAEARAVPGFVEFETKPSISAIIPPLDRATLYSDPSGGRIWVAVFDSAPGRPVTSNPVSFDIVEPDGRYVGRVRGLPRYLAAVRGDRAWVIIHDDDGVPTVVCYRITWE